MVAMAMPYVFTVFWSEGRECNKRKKHTHTHENKDSQNTLLLWKGLLSLPPSRLFLPPSLPLYQSHRMPISRLSASCETWRRAKRGIVLSHSTSGADQRASWKFEASGPINNRTAELRVRQQSADEPVSTKHIVPSPLPPSSRGQLSL